MLERVVVDTELRTWRQADGHWVQKRTKVMESDHGGGRHQVEVERYGPMTEAEAVVVIEAIATARMPGTREDTQLSIFDMA